MPAAAVLFLQAAAGSTTVGHTPCYHEETSGGHTFVSLGPARTCRRFRKPRSYDGVWIDEFEGSRFVEGVRTFDEARGRRADHPSVYWLSFDEQSQMDRLVPRRFGTAYRLRLTAQEMLPEPQRGPFPLPGFGHMGMSHREILANDVVMATRLRSPEP